MSNFTFILLLRTSTCFEYYCANRQEFGTMLLNFHVGCFILALLCVGVCVQFG